MRVRLNGKKENVFQGQLQCQKTVSTREKFKYPAVFVQIQPFLELKEPGILLNRPNCGGISEC